jgi:hypothetical protein
MAGQRPDLSQHGANAPCPATQYNHERQRRGPSRDMARCWRIGKSTHTRWAGPSALMISPPSFPGRWPRLGWHRAFGANQNAGQRPAPSQHGANAPCRPSKRPRAPTARIIAWQGEMRAQWKSGSSTFVMGKAKAVGPQKSGTRLGRWMPPPPHPGLLPRGRTRVVAGV